MPYELLSIPSRSPSTGPILKSPTYYYHHHNTYPKSNPRNKAKSRSTSSNQPKPNPWSARVDTNADTNTGPGADANAKLEMPRGALDSEDVRRAQMEAVRGAGTGALKWGAAAAVLGGLGYAMSPVYRGLTIQFKVYVEFLYLLLTRSVSSFKKFVIFILLLMNRSRVYLSNGLHPST